MTNNNQSSQRAINSERAPEYAMSLSAMIRKVENEPRPRFIYSGIKEGSIGIIFGPSKSGKTMLCENLLMAIAAGLTEYLGRPISIQNRKALVLSMEEHHTNRTERNIKQIERLVETYGTEWLDRYVVAGADMPRYINTQADWELLTNVIKEHNPGIVVLDSITRMCQGIEESAVAQEFMRKLRQLSVDTGTTILAIHHTTKMFGTAIGIDNIAGSRVVAQELDFAIGVNKTMGGKRYVKDVFFRYASDDRDTVTEFSINEQCWLEAKGEVYEGQLLAASDGRRSDTNVNKIQAYLATKVDTETPFATWAELEARLVTGGEMSRGTMHQNLTKLIAAGKVSKSDDQYRLVE